MKPAQLIKDLAKEIRISEVALCSFGVGVCLDVRHPGKGADLKKANTRSSSRSHGGHFKNSFLPKNIFVWHHGYISVSQSDPQGHTDSPCFCSLSAVWERAKIWTGWGSLRTRLGNTTYTLKQCG